MKLVTIRDIDLDNKIILYRAPYDIEPVDGILPDLSRLTATLPTLRYLLDHHCSIAILTYVGRPGGQIIPGLSTSFHAEALSKLLNFPVRHTDKSFNETPKTNEILMLENVRFFPEEDKNDDNFAKKLTTGFDLCVFDAFPQAHRTQSSTTGIEKHLQTVAGLYLEQEHLHLTKLTENPTHPFTVIIGGAKITDKVDAIDNLLNLADHLLIGGATANIFLAATGMDMKNSYLTDSLNPKDSITIAKNVLAKDTSHKIVLPSDLIWENDAAIDLGPQTINTFSKLISSSETVFWNGPLGKTDLASKSIIETLAGQSSIRIIAGGDTIALIDKYSSPDKFTYLSLAGGATLEFLASHPLPALTPLFFR